MKSLRVKRACCCLSLRTGNLIVGWLGSISWTTLLVTYIAVLVTGTEDIFKEDIKHTESPKEKKEDRTLFLLIGIVICLVNVLISIAHLYGTYKYRKSYLKPNLIIGAIQLGALALSILYGLVTANINRVCSGIFAFAIAFYYYLLPWSFYKEIDEGHAPVEHGQVTMELH